MKKVLFVKALNFKYSDEDILNIYNCIKELSGEEDCEFHYCKNNTLINILLKFVENKTETDVDFNDKTDAYNVIEYAVKNNIKSVVLLGIGHNFVLLYKMGCYINKIKVYAV